MKVHDQLDAIMALPIGGAILAFALCFFFALAALVHLAIDTKRNRRSLRDLAAKMPGRSDV